MEHVLLELGQKIRELRTKRGLSLDKLAEAANVNDKYLGEVERGQTNISVGKLCQIAAALDIKPHDLLDTAHTRLIDRDAIIQKLHATIESASDEELYAIYGVITDIVA
jgi:transcriptional regulator with XRE-family HTH domain